MYLKSLEISGFKSFAKKAELDFAAPITAVVGPNGSGKSNVAESFRFALGEQSMKSMRGRKGEDLIWNGSPNVPRSNRASVKVTFDNTRRFLDIDFDEVTIERVVHRDGVNEYLLNGTPVRLKDVTELLAGAHIGASGHHIISQGEADRILSANPRERREMIEDALGLKVYHYKRIESERKLEKTEENLKEVASLRRELAPHLAFLKKQVARIEKSRELRGVLVERYREYFCRERAYLDTERAAVAGEKEVPAAELSALDARIVELRRAIEASEQNDAESKTLLTLDEKLRTAREAVATLVREQGRIEGAVAAEERRLKRLESATADTRSVPFSDVSAYANAVGGAAERVISATDIVVARAAGEDIKRETGSFLSKAQHAEATAERDEAKAELARLANERQTLEAQLGQANANEARVREEYAAVRTKMEAEKDSSRAAERELFEAMGRRNDLSMTIAALKAREDRVTTAEEEYKRELAEAAVVAGREALAYDHAVKDEAGNDVPAATLAATPREEQAELRREIEKMKIRIEEMGGGAGDDVMKEYQDASERDAFLAREIADLEQSAQSIRQLIAELLEKLATEFEVGLAKINTAFGELFALMFGGGVAKLAVVEIKRRGKSDDEDEEGGVSAMLAAMNEGVDADEEEEEVERGIEVSVSLPHKRVRGLEMLSGGERALTSIALLFAISRVNPPPFIILDETDAALDEANSRKYGDMIAELAKASQLILITHNRETMSRAGVLYGITMGGDGVSRLLSIKFEEAVAVAK